MRKGLIGFASGLATVALATALAGPPRERLGDDDRTDPAGAREGDFPFESALREDRPRVVLLGNSITACAVDAAAFEQLTGAKTLDLTVGGSSSAIWYLVLKNFVAKASPRPEFAILGFRDVYLTVPDYRVVMGYDGTLNRFVDGEEPLLDRLAYFRDTGPVSYLLMRHWSLFQKRNDIDVATEALFKEQLASRIAGVAPEEIGGAVDRVFAEENKLPDAVTAAQQRAENVVDPAYFDFHAELERSFLPEMIKIARENDIRLILMRMRPRRNAREDGGPARERAWITDLLPKYMADLEAYLAENDVPFLDFEDDERIVFEWFERGDHLNKDPGQVGFTKLLAEAVAPYLDAAR